MKKKYSNKFNTMFWFFLKSYRKGILTFSGSVLKVHKGEEDSKLCFQKYENGEYKTKTISSRQSNVLFCVITAKKSWGLFLNEWTDGIVDCLFTREEILGEFEENGIIIPEPLLKDFENTILRKKKKRNEKYLESWKKN